MGHVSTPRQVNRKEVFTIYLSHRFEQECIPVGCIRPLVDRMLESASRGGLPGPGGGGGVCLVPGGICLVPGGSAWCWGGMSGAGGVCLVPGGLPGPGGVSAWSGGSGIPACTEADTPPWTDRHL